MLDAAKRASAKRITVVAPFYPYARQDKKGRGREPICARLVADLLKAAGADRIMSVDLHAAQIQGFFDGPVDHLFAMPVLLEHFQRDARPRRRSPSSRPTWAACASPTSGATSSARRSRSSTSAATRSSPNQVTVHEIVGEVDGRVCLLVDDMIDTGRTIVKAAEALKANGAIGVVVAATHAVFCDPAAEHPAERVDRRGRRHRHPADPGGEALHRPHGPADRAAARARHPRGLRGRLGHEHVRRRRLGPGWRSRPRAPGWRATPRACPTTSSPRRAPCTTSCAGRPSSTATTSRSSSSSAPPRTPSCGDQIERAAEGLRLLGVQKGDPVALVLPNCPQHIVAFYAVLRLGAIVVEHNPLYTPRELRHQFEDHGARVVIAWDKVVETIQAFPADVAVAVDHLGRRHPGDAVPHALHAAAPDREGARVPRRAHHEGARHHAVGRARGIRRRSTRTSSAPRHRRRRPHPVHERHDRQPEGRHPDAREPRRRTPRRRAPGCPRSSAARRSSTPCCRCSTPTGSRCA